MGRPIVRGAFITWEAPDSDFVIIQGWLVYKETPDGETLRLTDSPLQVREFTDRVSDADLGITRYWVTALSHAGVESRESTPAIVIFENDPPSAPTRLSAAPGADHIFLTWFPGPELDLAGYFVYRDGSIVFRVGDPDAPSFLDLDVVRGRDYVYTVTAVDLRGHESPHSEPVTARIPALYRPKEEG
jgi:hypothetical protein